MPIYNFPETKNQKDPKNQKKPKNFNVKNFLDVIWHPNKILQKSTSLQMIPHVPILESIISSNMLAG
jgi:hypothetical protein